MALRIILLLTLLPLSFHAADLADDSELYEGKEYKNAFANPKDSPRPNVLLIGDSISIGYTVNVRKLLKGEADIFRIKGNGKFSAFGLQNIDKWTAGRKWNVIHFNWGLWDLCYRNPESKTQGHRDKINGKITVSPEEYKKNLTAIVAKLKKTGAHLIWCNTTPVPEHEAGRKKGDDLIYNKIAAEVMKENNIHINDLHAHALKALPAIQIKKGDVHFNQKGNKHLAEKVAAEISKALDKKK